MFHFRLETLLRLRLAERDKRRAELAKALKAEAMLRDQERAIRDEAATLAARGRQLKSPGTADVDALLQTHRYEIVLAARIRQLAAQIAQVAAEAERRRLAVVEADRQVRVLEKLRERQAAAQYREDQRQAAKQFDEAAVLGFVRRQEVTP